MIFTAQPKQGFGVRCNGLTVTKVTGGSQAERLGVQEGDVIVKISGKTMANVKEITNSLSEGKMGQKPYEVEIKRSGLNYGTAQTDSQKEQLQVQNGRVGYHKQE